MGPEVLAQVLRPLTFHSAPPALLVGLHAADDAAVYKVNEQQAIISTADFFPPVVDDPYAFGAIAAANAMSDVYAMGGQVLMAINLVAWPDDLDPALQSMRQLNRKASQALSRPGVHAVTDITGFGLLGHAWEMASQSLTGMRFQFDTLPLLPHARHYAELGCITGGAHRNETYLSPHVHIDERLDAFDRELLWDPQTSGGLFAAVDPKVWPTLATLAPNVMFWLIGEVTERVEDEVNVVLEVY